MSVPTAVFRGTVFSYYMVFGNIEDVVFLTFWLFWVRGELILELFESFNTQLFVRAATLPAWNGPARPLLFPCRTSHARLFPKKHSFSYSYLLVGIPVGWTGPAGDLISNEEHSTGVKGWYNIDAADCLERGNGHLGLRGKLDAYLESQGIYASKYPHAYLVTAAKFLGYHLNPFSFWYLYSADKCLAAIILEVSNTFDEKRMYFLTPSVNDIRSIRAPENDAAAGDSRAHRPCNSTPLRQTWPRDSHVSLFNSEEGSCSLAAHDPLLPHLEGQGRIDGTIKLESSKNNAKLVVRVFSEGDAIDPTTMTTLQKLKFLAISWGVSFVTFPRIVKEAGACFFKRKLHVWYSPGSLKTSIGRQADKTERQLEPLFRRYLEHLVEQSPEPLTVRYTPSGIVDAQTETMISPQARKAPTLEAEMDFKVLTPVFYSRFVYYAHDFEAIFCELNENNTIWVSKPELLPKLIIKKQPPPLLQTTSYLDYGYYMAIKNLRQRPERIEQPLTSSSQSSRATSSQKDIRGFRLSAMDGYVLTHEDTKARHVYRSSVLKLFIADRIAMRRVKILQLQKWVLEFLLAWVAMS
ncbi:hypothetical protein GGR53DRAFT_524971 [Hypoxylon sp. FL1150]|nr:hypothetical protein GGR53DRAFT_524971 [Hypoxylon sp. FL1150]